MKGATMQDAGFNAVNAITADIQDVKDNLKNVQASVLEALADN